MVVELDLIQRRLVPPQRDLVVRARIDVVEDHPVRSALGAEPKVGDVDGVGEAAARENVEV